jgi:hypothetical protein
MASRPTVSLRFTNPGLRERVRVLAAQRGISQNEFLERAAEHEVVVQGGLLSGELEALAGQLGEMSAATLSDRVEASKANFVAGEALPDPLRPRQIRREPPPAVRTSSRIGAVAAFGGA